MPLPISSAVIEEINKLNNEGDLRLSLEIEIPGVEDHVRIVRDNANMVWPSVGGDTYIAFPFEIEEIGDSSKGEVPRVDVRVSNITGAMESYIQDYDAYIKNNGYSPVIVWIRVVHSLHLDLPEPEVEYIFELKAPKTNPKWATFTLGASNPFNRRFPQNRLLKNHGRVRVYKDKQCDPNNLLPVGTALTGTASSSGVAVTGVGTLFLTELNTNDYIGTAALGRKRIAAIADNTHLTIESAFLTPLDSEAVKKMGCDRTLARCRELGNSGRYCGFPGVGQKSLYL